VATRAGLGAGRGASEVTEPAGAVPRKLTGAERAA